MEIVFPKYVVLFVFTNIEWRLSSLSMLSYLFSPTLNEDCLAQVCCLYLFLPTLNEDCLPQVCCLIFLFRQQDFGFAQICCFICLSWKQQFRNSPSVLSYLFIMIITNIIIILITTRFTPELFFYYLLPPIILEAAYCLHNKHFFDNIRAILWYPLIIIIYFYQCHSSLQFQCNYWFFKLSPTPNPLPCSVKVNQSCCYSKLFI